MNIQTYLFVFTTVFAASCSHRFEEIPNETPRVPSTVEKGLENKPNSEGEKCTKPEGHNAKSSSRGWDDCTAEIARISFQYAQMSDRVYYALDEKGEKIRIGNDCSIYMNNNNPLPKDCEYFETRKESTSKTAGRFYNKLFDIPEGYHYEERRVYRSGMAYDLYTKCASQSVCASSDDVIEIVLAFRGTNFGEWADWLHGNVGEQQRYQALATYDVARIRFPNARIITTGHSLGGSLAIQVSLCRDVEAAYSFDGSPRFRESLCDKERYFNRNFQIVEKGEILRYVRPLRFLGDGPAWTWKEVGCRPDGDPIENHSMVELAACLTAIASTPHPIADLDENMHALRQIADRSMTTNKICADVAGVSNRNIGLFYDEPPEPTSPCATGIAEP